MNRCAAALVAALFSSGACTRSDDAGARASAGDAATDAANANPPIKRCDLQAKFDDATGEIVASASIIGFEDKPVMPTGTLEVRVEHQRQGADFRIESAPACTVGSSKVVRAAYAADQKATVRIKLPATCPREPPDGWVVSMHGRLQSDGWDAKPYCAPTGPIPAAVGGGDLSIHDQFQALKSKRGGDAAKVAQKLAASIATAMRDIDPNKSPETKTCPASVAGPAIVLPYDVVWRAAAKSSDAGTLREPLSKGMAVAVVGGSKLAGLMNRTNDPASAAETEAEVKNASPLVVIATTLEIALPAAEFAESTSGGTRRGRMTPGRHRGGLFVVDRVKGGVLCSTVASAQSSSSKYEAPTPTAATQAMNADFTRQIESARADALKKIAPALVVAR